MKEEFIMKKAAIFILCISFLTSACVASKKVELAELNSGSKLIKVNDSRWDGEKVPYGEQGTKCGGVNPHFPSLTFDLKGLNKYFNSKVVGIKMSAYDVDWPQGSHGKWSYFFDPQKDSFISPKVPSETPDMPKGIKGLSMHTSRSCPAGYYLAPSSCLATRGHKYFTDITLILENGENVVIKFSQGVY